MLSTVKRLKQEHANTDQTKQEGETMERKKNQAALQVLKDNRWVYVFCLSEHNEVITTENRRKALGGHALQYFTDRKANDTFRINQSKEVTQ